MQIQLSQSGHTIINQVIQSGHVWIPYPMTILSATEMTKIGQNNPFFDMVRQICCHSYMHVNYSFWYNLHHDHTEHLIFGEQILLCPSLSYDVSLKSVLPGIYIYSYVLHVQLSCS